MKSDNDNGLLLHPVQSRGIRALGYDPAGRRLYVMYPNRRLYQYEDVSPQRHRALLAADSIGEYVNEHIKPNYRFKRLN